MKLPSLKRDTPSALETARQALAAIATEIAELQSRRDAALTADADIEQVAALDDEAHKQGNRLRALQDKISLLEGRLASEQEEQRKADYRAAVDKIAAALPRRAKAAEGVERALGALAGAVKEFMVATEGVLKVWPDGVEFPATAYPGHALSLERLGGLVHDVFVPSRGHADRRPPTPAEYLTRAADADRHRAFASIERELCEQWLADLKTAHDPAPLCVPNAETESESEAVA